MDNVSSIRLHPHTVSLIWALSVCIIELFGTVECKGLLTLNICTVDSRYVDLAYLE